MISFFDSVFCLIYRKYEKWGERNPYPFAEGILVAFQIFLFYDIFTLLSFFDLFPKKIENVKIFALFFALLVYSINHRRYKKNYKGILVNNKYVFNNIKTFAIYLVILISIIFPLIIGVLRNNFGYNI